MKKILSKLLGGVLLFNLSMSLTSCDPYLDDVLGKWSRPTPGSSTGGAVIVTSIELDADEMTLAIDDKGQLAVKAVTPDNATDKTVSWSSNKEATATVDASGLVTAVAAGTAIITATANDGSGVTATCAVTVLPKGALAGVFSVSATKRVRFSKGNLQAVIASGPTDTYNYTASSWKFAENQWDYIGKAAGNTTFAASSTVDLFGWVGTSASYDTYGLCTNTSTQNAYYGTVPTESLKSDWGTNMGAGWRTLTGGDSGEWKYLFNTRGASTVGGTENARYAKAYLFGTTHGVILFPDIYTHPDGVAAPTGINDKTSTSWGANQYTTAEWKKMEAAGCVFLPAAGLRSGLSVDAALVNAYGYYWSSSPYTSIATSAYREMFSSGSQDDATSVTPRSNALSVRLVYDVK